MVSEEGSNAYNEEVSNKGRLQQRVAMSPTRISFIVLQQDLSDGRLSDSSKVETYKHKKTWMIRI